jgi:Protein of unknown function (DUF3574)
VWRRFLSRSALPIIVSRLSMLTIAASLAACVVPGTRSCTAGVESPMLVFNLFFGKSISGRSDLTEDEWQQFLDDTVTANLPDGHTVIDAKGAWMNPVTHRTIKEDSKLLIVALPAASDSLAAVNRVRTEYQVRFRQQLVGMTVEQACGSF